MVAQWQIEELIKLVQQRYPGWSDFAHPPFVADELDYKHKAVDLAQSLLGEAEVQALLSNWQYDEILQRALRLGRETNLLWLRVPRQGDLSLLYRDDVDKAEFAQQLARLWHGTASLAERVQRFGTYALARQLPLKWPFVSYFLFLLHPTEAMFVKPTVMQWALKFVGQGEQYGRRPSGTAYQSILNLADALKSALEPFGARDMVDIQSFLWVAAREGKGQTGRLTPRGQIDLDLPQLEEGAYQPAPDGAKAVAESPIDYVVRNEVMSKEQLGTRLCVPVEVVTGWLTAINRKRQAVFYGPPGTGKTFAAEQVGEYLIGGGDGFVERLQLHPSYAYEEFIQGIRPDGDGFALKEGRFLSFCRRAAARQNRCILILDEMNRAPLARVFGELMYLLEYRDQAVPLAGGGEFAIPENVILLGTMNTADRSIALVDFALRRRFAFLEMTPNYALLRQFHEETTGVDIEALVRQLQRINQLIDDPAYALGVSFFLTTALADEVGSIWQTEIEPYLVEYFFDRPERMDPFRWGTIRDVVLK